MQTPTASSSVGRIFVTGGTGFVGRHIIAALGGRPLRLLVREPANQAEAGAADLVRGDVTDPASLAGTMDGCDTVIHLVAIIEESGDATFDRVIRQGTENVLSEAKRAGVSRFIHMSALGAMDDPRFGYQQAKYRAEQAVIGSGLNYTIFRPSVIFGKGDGFITTLAGVIRSFPVIPVVGDGKTRFQPVQINDVADAFVRAVDDPESTTNQIYELGGARPYTYEAMLDAIADELGKRKPKVNVPVGLMKVVVGASAPLPKALRPPVTSEQLKMLALDNSTGDSATERLIGRKPVALEDGIGYIRTS
jgi:NADH dehydrogenase